MNSKLTKKQLTEQEAKERRIQFIEQNRDNWKQAGEELKKRRLKARLSIENVAGHIGISSTTLSKLERGLPVKNSKTLEKAYDLYITNHELAEIKNTVDRGKFLTARNLSGYITNLNSYIQKEHEKINKITDTLRLIYGDKLVSVEICDLPSVLEDPETKQVFISASCEAFINVHSEETQKFLDSPLQIYHTFPEVITDISKELQSILEEIKLAIESDRGWNKEYYEQMSKEAM